MDRALEEWPEALAKFGKTYSEVAGLLMRYKEVYEKLILSWVDDTNKSCAGAWISFQHHLGWDRHFPDTVF